MPRSHPNIVFVFADQMRGQAFGAGGNRLVRTPNIDRIAREGVRVTNAVSSYPVCSPYRASLLTGRNHHAVGMGLFPELALHHEGYHGRVPKTAATLARVLKDGGFSTFAIGKWHLTPRGEFGASGPFDHWPLGWGFDHWWGFLTGAAGQYDPIIT